MVLGRSVIWFLISFAGDWIHDLTIVPRQMLGSSSTVVSKAIWMNVAVHSFGVKQSIDTAAAVKGVMTSLTLQLHDGSKLLEVPSVRSLRCALVIFHFPLNFFLLWLESLLNHLGIFKLVLFVHLLLWTKLVNRCLSMGVPLFGHHFSHLLILIIAPPSLDFRQFLHGTRLL